MTRPSELQWCEPHSNPLPCEQCITEANYDGDLFTSRPAALATPVDFHPLTAAFLAFHARNPHIYFALVEELRVLWTAGVRKCAIATVYEVVRWRLTLNAYADMARSGDEVDGTTFSMSNTHKTFYVRLLEHLNPSLEGFFDKQKSAEAENDMARWLSVAVDITRKAGQA